MKQNGIEYYFSFIGKGKDEIYAGLKEKFNCYPDNIWICEIRKTWWGQRMFLVLKFDEQNILKNITIEIHIL
ncbi:hypothetical protein BAX94_04210 [Elizabethkingia meningoseptica]|uniref:Uncharacterized protein n=1 Tax=Elizabethkingia meningoseptica TaxID=238 RepID=A0A1V3U3I2_ELIME|nr:MULTISPECIES: hypothetical protein [Elizabethkingia]AQX06500.1 hypothetical protein BBD33_15080 [Elizabethkingia meningoseptica]AQX14028.1 hypothetical protein BBD35_17355 [Elizabethkingia meningoseptica]AQX48547.1 hypothetical protein B5G46_15070 [Elizabethkingia meningoseptica]EOR28569.1 hypothetical protein L100_15675 [Elizabethkingia meningoseptica ATCC 13253 = NBRC 12535]KUY13600.1 hypothetical protein ATB99_13680 [Elizabethkingia meningoseptica]